jgi:hypothetical protein
LTNKPKSRAKRLCLFGPRRNKAIHRQEREPQGTCLAPICGKPIGESSNSHPPDARVTLTHPQQQYFTLRDKYKGLAPPEPQPNPYRFIQRKLGLSEQEFDARITQDIDELMHEIEMERREALLESLPFGRTLSKEDCRKLFKPNFPPSGSLFGVFQWAYGLDDENVDVPALHEERSISRPP